jgi:hypothetical protein
MNKFKKFQSFLLGSLLSLTFTLPATAASTLQNSNEVEIQRSDVIAFPHEKKRQSTGSWKKIVINIKICPSHSKNGSVKQVIGLRKAKNPK